MARRLKVKRPKSIQQDPPDDRPDDGPVPVAVPSRVPPIDDDGWRVCARPECGVRFKPDVVTRLTCSTLCASIRFYQRHGMDVRKLLAQLEARAQAHAAAGERLALARAARGPRSSKPAPEGVIPVGSDVRYLGGAHTSKDWVTEGMVLKVAYYHANKSGVGGSYVLRMGSGQNVKRVTVAAVYIEPVK